MSDGGDTPADATYFVIRNCHITWGYTSTFLTIGEEYFVNYTTRKKSLAFQHCSNLLLHCHHAPTDPAMCQNWRPPTRALCEVDPQLSVGLMKAVAKAAMERLQMTRVLLVAQMADAPKKPDV
jgi:hypothetical protein